MDDIIETTGTERPERVIKLIADLDRIHFFKTAFDSGGYVAGGLARYVLTDTRADGGLVGIHTKFLQPHGSDIDLFFADLDGLRMTFESLTYGQHEWRVISSSTGNALDVVIECETAPNETHDIKVQLIKCHVGHPRAVIDGFDFTNCKFAFDRTDCFMSQAALQLEQRHELEITRFHPPTLTWRLTKYVTIHGYRRLTDASYVGLMDFVIENAKDAKTLAMVKKLMTRNVFKPEDVILLATLFPEKTRVEMTSDLNTAADAGYNLF